MKYKLETLDTPNKNNRIYSKDLMVEVIENTKTLIKENRLLFSRIDDFTRYCGDVRIENIAGKINELYIVDNELFCDLEFLNTSSGISAEKIENDLEVGLVGMGRTTENENGSFTVIEYELKYISFSYPEPK